MYRYQHNRENSSAPLHANTLSDVRKNVQFQTHFYKWTHCVVINIRSVSKTNFYMWTLFDAMFQTSFSKWTYCAIINIRSVSKKFLQVNTLCCNKYDQGRKILSDKVNSKSKVHNIGEQNKTKNESALAQQNVGRRPQFCALHYIKEFKK